MAKGKAKEQELSLEQAVARLDEIVEELESGETDLEKSIALYEEGKKLGASALQKLESLERRIQVIAESEEDEVKLEDFEKDETD